MGLRRKDGGSEWTTRDDALVWTCRLARDVQEGRSSAELPWVAAPFGPDERMLVTGPFMLSDYRALGNGSWSAPGYIALGRPAFVVGAAIGHSVAKSRARSRAAAAAVPRWLPIDRGTLYVSSQGWHMYTPRLMSWTYRAMTSASMVGPGILHLTGDSRNGPISWLLHSDWAELVFVLWALARHPDHPQMLSQGWLPPGWLERAQLHQGDRTGGLALPS